MRYTSTRDASKDISFQEAVSEGLSPEGGLYLPRSIPDISTEIQEWGDLPYVEKASRIFGLFAGASLSAEELEALVPGSLSTFTSEEKTPLVKVGDKYILELFHGPTLSFKDVALQTLGSLFEHWPLESGQRTILGATSGDTGSAAIAGVRGKKGVRAFILFPEGRVSPVQELQMTTVPDENVHCLSVEGSFDDCQDIVKALFADVEFRSQVGLSAVNSINWARITAQIVYYIHGYFQWLKLSGHAYGEPLSVSVPTGNFGDVLAGYIAKKLGLPLGKLIVASNENDILTRFGETGRYEMREVIPSTSPAMDIQISSNFERLLFWLHGGDDVLLASKMKELRSKGSFEVSPDVMARFKEDFVALRTLEGPCLETIRRYEEELGYVLDPHTSVGVHAAQECMGEEAVMCLATAHPGKFQEAVERATKKELELPKALSSLLGLPVRKTIIPASLEKVKDFILSH